MNSLRDEKSLTLTLRPHSTEVRRVRDKLRAFLIGWGAPGEVVEVATLLASELVTNAVCHAGTEVGVVASVAHGVLRVSVTDGISGRPEVRRGAIDAADGRGLAVVEDLASAWGIDGSADVDGDPGGKTVWFELGVPTPG